MKEAYSNYFKTDDGEQILYSTNFKVEENTSYENVIVFNYGLVCSNVHWEKQIEFFDKLGFKILTHDYRGHFNSTSSPTYEDITFDQITNDIYQLLTRLNFSNVILLGHSMGVNITLELCYKFPNLVSKAILISGTAVPVFNIMFHSNITDQLLPLIESGYSKFPKLINNFWKFSGWNPLSTHLTLNSGFNPKQVPIQFVEVYLNKVGQLGFKLFFHLIQEMNKHHILSKLPQIKTEILLVGGDNDKVIPNYLQKLMNEKLPNSQLYLMRKGSHVPQADFPEMINERIQLFIKN